jgi:hypothetical protein
MIPIEQTAERMLIFLECGCAAVRVLSHPTGAASLVQVWQPCEAHAGEKERVRAVLKGAMVSPLVRTPVRPDSIQA